jgi:2-isopropylmalate synthase
VAFSVSDKLEIVSRLDEIGFDFIEGGWPGSNPKDDEFFEQVKAFTPKHSRLAAFGMTRRASTAVDADPTLAGLLATGAGVVTIFGKTWDLHVREALRTDGDENLKMIEESVAFVVAKGKDVIFDAEHFFDGWKSDASYAPECLRAAVRGGAGRVVLCDTNGGSLPAEIAQATCAAKEAVGDLMLGIHTHNDGGLAVANSLVAVEAGCRHVQGTVNGFGERSGNADLCVLIPALQLKAGYDVLAPETLSHLTELSRYVYEMAMLPPRDFQPYVGRSAFAHKGGVHVSAVARNPVTYEHIRPELVGNERRVLISELSGRSTILAKTSGLAPDSDGMKRILEKVQDLEHAGYQFEAAEASFEVLSRKILGTHKPFFKLEGFRVISELDEQGADRTEATIKLSVGGEEEHTAAEGNGPVNALDGALRKGLVPFYPDLSEVQLTNFKVRIVNPLASTAARVLVLIESRDSQDRWATVGVSENVIEASWIALVDSVEYKLFKDGTQPPGN